MFINPIFASSFTKTQFQKKPLNYNQAGVSASVSFKGETDYFDYEARLKAKLNARSKWQKFWGSGKKKAKEDVNSELIGFNISQATIVKKIEKTIDDKEALLKEKEKSIKLMEEKNALIEKQYKDAIKNNEKDEIIISLKKQLEQLKQQTITEKQNYTQEIDKINNLKEEQAIITGREAGKGWDKIAGHKKLKTQLEEVFINKIPLEKAGYEVNMPNGILLYGQHGTGKTRFAQAFAEEAKCNFVKIDMLQDNDEIIDDIRAALKKAKKTYNSPETPKKRTIILLDDFNSIAKLSEEEKKEIASKGFDFEDTAVGQLEKLLSDCSSKYKATIFMTTNHPKKIDSELLNKNLVPFQIFLGPPNPQDAAEIFKYHTQGFTEQDIDYIQLGNKISKAIINDEAYSAQGIVNIVEHAKEKVKGAQITHTDLLMAIDQVKPDISAKTFNDFLDDMADLLEETLKVNERNN